MNKKYHTGQLWEYITPVGKENTRLIILKTESLKNQDIVHVSVTGADIDVPQHMPFSESSIDASVTKIVEEDYPLPEFQEGYEYWKSYFLKGEAGVYELSVKEALEINET